MTLNVHDQLKLAILERSDAVSPPDRATDTEDMDTVVEKYVKSTVLVSRLYRLFSPARGTVSLPSDITAKEPQS